MSGIDHVRREVRALRAYDEAPTSGLNLMSNTNLFGPNPAMERALAKVRPDRLSEYPSISSQPLREAVAKKLGVTPGMVVTGNGSNDLIDLVCRTFLDPGDRVAFHPPTFAMIPLLARANHGQATPVALSPEWEMDPHALAAAEAKLTILVRPNNPTGNAFPRKDVETLIDRARGIVVVDEAYVEFLGGESFVKEIRGGNDRVIILRTLSKAHGIAGLRIGYAVAAEPIAEEINKVRGPFRLGTLAETVGALALADDRYLDATVAAVRAERSNLKRMLEERGFVAHRSDANFLFTRPPVPAHALAQALAQQGIMVREFQGDLSPYLRITVGPPTATARLRLALDDVLPRLRGAP